MASIKNLKKNINKLSGELFTECVFCRMYIPNINSEKIDGIIVDILQNQSSFLKRSKHTDGKSDQTLTKKHYKNLKADINKYIEKVVKDIEVNIHN